jgi:hypothetical protein
MNLFGYLLERASVRVDAYVELVRILTSGLVYKETISGPQVDDHSFAGKGR